MSPAILPLSALRAPSSHAPLDAASATCFAGALRFLGDCWRWRDGTIETLVADEAPARLGFACRRMGDGRAFVEVPASISRIVDRLGWVLAGIATGVYDIDLGSVAYAGLPMEIEVGSDTSCAIGERVVASSGLLVALIPLAHWRGWCDRTPNMPVWRRHDEPGLEASARRQGWRG